MQTAPTIVDPFETFRRMGQTGLFATHPQDPARYNNAASSFLITRFFHEERPTLANWNGEFWKYNPQSRLWSPTSTQDVTNEWVRWTVGLPSSSSFTFSSTAATHVIAALKAITQVQMDSQPCWRSNVVDRLRALALLPEGDLPHPDFCISFADQIVDAHGAANDPLNSLTDLYTYGYERNAEWFDASRLPCNYNPEMDLADACPNWLDFLDSSLESDKDLIETLQRFFGYCLLPATHLQKFLFLYGAAGSGKSTIVSILSDLFPPSAVASASLTSLSERFGLMHLPHKRLLLVPDISAKTLINHVSTERIKAITGNDGVFVERKYLPPLANCRLNLKTVMVSNQLPEFDNTASAISRRMLLIPFNKSFIGKEDPKLLGRLRNEISGIAHWAFWGALKLIQAEAAGEEVFPSSARTALTTRVFNLMTNTNETFFKEAIEVTGEKNDFISNDQLYLNFAFWANRENLSVPKKKSWLYSINQLNFGTPDRSWQGAKPYGRRGIKFRPEFISSLEVPNGTP